MTREDVLKLFPDATDEQITKILNQNNSEVAREKDKASKYKEKADKADELQGQLDDLTTQNMTELEKATKLLDESNKKIAELEKRDAIRTQRALAVEKFKITSEQAQQVVKDDGSYDMDVLGQIISDKEVASATAKEQEIANNAINPSGGNAGGGENKSNAERLASKFFSGQKQENNILSHYVNGGN